MHVQYFTPTSVDLQLQPKQFLVRPPKHICQSILRVQNCPFSLERAKSALCFLQIISYRGFLVLLDFEIDIGCSIEA